MHEISGDDMEHLGGYDGSRGVDGDGFVGGAQRGSFTRSTDVPLGKGRVAFVGREEILGEIGDFLSANVGSMAYGGYTAQTDLAKTGKGTGAAFVGHHGRGRGRGGSPALRQAKHEAKKIRKHLMRMVDRGQTIPAAKIDEYFGAANRAFLAKHGRPADVTQTQHWKEHLLAQIARKGGMVDGTIVSGMGDWLGKIVNAAVVWPAKGIAKGVEFGVRTTGNVATGVFSAGKKTFFPGSGGKPAPKKVSPAGVVTNAIPSDDQASSNDLRTYAQRMARTRSENRRRHRDLQSRLQLAQSKQALAAQEDAEEAKLADLEAQAAEAEADAEADSSGDDGPVQAIAAAAGNKAIQARVAQAVVKSAGNLAKGIFFNNPFVKMARQVWLEAKVDTKGAQKVANIKALAAQGDEKSQAAMSILQTGKKAEEEVQAADVVNKALLAKAAEGKGVPTDVVGMLPSNEKVISVIPGAKDVYHLAKSGHPKAVAAVRKGGDLVRRASAGDVGARDEIRKMQRGAAAGNKKEQLNMAVVAVSAAGLRESKALTPTNAAALTRVHAQADTLIHRLTSPLAAGIEKLTGGRRYTEGLAIKIAQR